MTMRWIWWVPSHIWVISHGVRADHAIAVKTSLEERKHLSVVLVDSHLCPTLDGPTRAPKLINRRAPEIEPPFYAW